MTTPPTTHGPRTAALAARAADLRAALERGGARVPTEVAREVARTLDAVQERLALGVDHTVVALAGGTGSGKSSLFNALSGLEFADVGVRRPTTAEVTACVWAHDAEGLLDWLGVSRDRRIERESALDGESQADLRGLVLLDLPDHDSVEPQHRAVVDRLLPQVDLMVWVVDPQKYADDALHSRYLRRLTGHEGSMLVLLNQIDTVPTDAQASVLRDVARLLGEDGLEDVGVHAVSARTGDGLPVVRGVLARAVGSRGVAETRAAAELDDAAAALRATVTREPEVTGAAGDAVEGMVAAAGVGATADAVEQAVRSGSAAPVHLGPVQPDGVAAVREAWVDGVTHGLPPAWVDAVTEAVAPAEEAAASADARLAAVTVPLQRPRGATVWRVLAAVAAFAALVIIGFTAGAAVGDGWSDRVLLLAATAGGVVAVVIGLLLLARGARRAAARRRAATVTQEARRALAAVVDEAFVRPTVAVLEDHRAVREAAEVRIAQAGARTGTAQDGAGGRR